jgi:hypothetical protein
MSATRAPRAVSPGTIPLAVAVGALALAPTLVRPDAHGPVLCPLRRVTGVWCPTCGMTRAMGWMAHLDLDQALKYHPFAPVLLLQAVLVAGLWLVLRRSRRDGPVWPAGWTIVGRAAVAANAAVLLIVWVVRLRAGSFDDLG